MIKLKWRAAGSISKISRCQMRSKILYDVSYFTIIIFMIEANWALSIIITQCRRIDSRLMCRRLIRDLMSSERKWKIETNKCCFITARKDEIVMIDSSNSFFCCSLVRIHLQTLFFIISVDFIMLKESSVANRRMLKNVESFACRRDARHFPFHWTRPQKLVRRLVRSCRQTWGKWRPTCDIWRQGCREDVWVARLRQVTTTKRVDLRNCNLIFSVIDYRF